MENLTRVPELFLVFSCADGEVSLWTLDGLQVGSFGGRHRSWQLGRPSTYASSESSCEWGWLPRRRQSSFLSVRSSAVIREELETLDEGEADDAAEGGENEDTLANALLPPTAVFIKNCTISALNGSTSEPRENFLLEDTMPKPGEVWICVSGHRSRAAAQNASKKLDDADGELSGDGSFSGCIGRKSLALSTVGNAAILSRRSSPFGPGNNNGEPRTLATPSYLKRKIADVNGEVTDLITIVKVTRGEVMCLHQGTSMQTTTNSCCGFAYSTADLVLGRQREQPARCAESTGPERVRAESWLDQARIVVVLRGALLFVSLLCDYCLRHDEFVLTDTWIDPCFSGMARHLSALVRSRCGPLIRCVLSLAGKSAQTLGADDLWSMPLLSISDQTREEDVLTDRFGG